MMGECDTFSLMSIVAWFRHITSSLQFGIFELVFGFHFHYLCDVGPAKTKCAACSSKFIHVAVVRVCKTMTMTKTNKWLPPIDRTSQVASEINKLEYYITLLYGGLQSRFETGVFVHGHVYTHRSTHHQTNLIRMTSGRWYATTNCMSGGVEDSVWIGSRECCEMTDDEGEKVTKINIGGVKVH